MVQSTGECFICCKSGGSRVKCCTCKKVYVHGRCLDDYIKHNITDAEKPIYACPHCRKDYKNIIIKKRYRFDQEKPKIFLEDFKGCCISSAKAFCQVSLCILKTLCQLGLYLMSIIYVGCLVIAVICLPWAINIYRVNHSDYELEEWEKGCFIGYVSLIFFYYMINFPILAKTPEDITNHNTSKTEGISLLHINFIDKMMSHGFDFAFNRFYCIAEVFTKCEIFPAKQEGKVYIDRVLLMKSGLTTSFLIAAFAEECLVIGAAAAPLYFIIQYNVNDEFDLKTTIIIAWSGLGINFIHNYLPLLVMIIIWCIIHIIFGLIMATKIIGCGIAECFKNCCFRYCLGEEESFSVERAVEGRHKTDLPNKEKDLESNA